MLNKLSTGHKQFLWVLTLTLLLLGISLPMFTFTKFYFFDDSFSLLGGIFHLLGEGEPLLFVMLFTFSILMPAYKMALLFRLNFVDTLSLSQKDTYDLQLTRMGKWSMLDVFVIAILVVTIKLRAIAEITIHVGLYLFAAGVICSMLLPHGPKERSAPL
jgi:paraquat-inducible protein A